MFGCASPSNEKFLEMFESHSSIKNKPKNSLFLRVTICLHRQVDKDCELLEQERIMDYSLLVGIHFKDRCKGKLHYACFYVLAPAKML